MRRYPTRDGELVIIARRPSFQEYVDIGFVQIGRYGASDARGAGALLDGLIDVDRAACRAGARERLEALMAADLGIAGAAVEAALTERDRQRIRELLQCLSELGSAAVPGERPDAGPVGAPPAHRRPEPVRPGHI